MVAKRKTRNFKLEDFWRDIILETGLSRRNCEDVVMSFLSNLQEKICEENVTIENFGTFKAVLEQRGYYDINLGKWVPRSDAKAIGKIRFYPVPAFQAMIKRELTIKKV